MPNDNKNQQGSGGMGGQSDKNAGGSSGNQQSERPDYAEKQRPGYDVDPNKESPSRKEAWPNDQSGGQGGSKQGQGQGQGQFDRGEDPSRAGNRSGGIDPSQKQGQKK
jgi:hypothetical protein